MLWFPISEQMLYGGIWCLKVGATSVAGLCEKIRICKCAKQNHWWKSTETI